MHRHHQEDRAQRTVEPPLPFDALIESIRSSHSRGERWPLPAPPFLPGVVRLVDFRPRAEFEGGHIPGACHLAPEELDLLFLLPPRWRPMVVLSDSVSEAQRAAERLHSHGYTARALDAPVSCWQGPWESGPETAPLWEPSRLIASWARRISAGPALDLACGSGRDAVFLAMHGLEVTGIDLLPDALEQAEKLAARHGVRLYLIQADIEMEASCWNGVWGAINVQRFLHRSLFPLFRKRLAEDGLLLYETFLQRQAQVGRKPRNSAHLLEAGELYSASRGLVVEEYCEGTDWKGDWIASLVARKGDDRVRP